jgi:hypothetical protein
LIEVEDNLAQDMADHAEAEGVDDEDEIIGQKDVERLASVLAKDQVQILDML